MNNGKYAFISPPNIFIDNNIILINKPVGILSHGASKEFEENIVDSMISYLIQEQPKNPDDHLNSALQSIQSGSFIHPPKKSSTGRNHFCSCFGQFPTLVL